MKKLIASLLVGALIVQPPPVLATETPDAELQEHLFLADVIEQLGVKINYGGAECRANRGLYGNYYPNGSVMNLCEVGDRDERLDTFRHEAFHVYQDIRDCNIKDDTALKPVFSNGAASREFIALAAKHYDKADIAFEAEAYWAAHTFTAASIGNLIVQRAEQCGFKFNF